MNLRILSKVVLSGLIFILITAQISVPNQFTRLERERYIRKMTNFRKNKIKVCNERAILIANAMVDSALIAQDILIDIDTMIAPNPPKKPKRPIVPNQGVDSIEIAPIFNSPFDN